MLSQVCDERSEQSGDGTHERREADHPQASASDAEHEHQELNIYAMMDMMTILLVFLIQQFATTSANITQSAELQIPTSVSERAAERRSW